MSGYNGVAPLAPAKFTGSLFLAGAKPIAECINFSTSLENSTGNYVETVAPQGTGTTPVMLGYMFRAAECQGTNTICTTPPNTCQGVVKVLEGRHGLQYPDMPWEPKAAFTALAECYRALDRHAP